MPYNDRKNAGRLHEDWRQWPRAVKEKVYRQFLEQEALERARELESKGWRVWYATMFGDEFVTNLADHHVEAIEWHWNAMVLKRAGLRVEKRSYPAIWPRGHRKSNIVRAMVVADACVLGIGYCLYVSGTKAKVRGHAISLETLISSPAVQEYYPALSRVKRNMQGSQKSWTADLMVADSGYSFHFIGLNEGVAGANIDNVRPSFIVLDDVDDRDDSPLISAQRMKVLLRSVLPTEQLSTLVFVAQNYISRHGVIYRIHTGKEIALTHRINTEAIPAVRNLVTEQRTIDGIVHDVVVSGEPTWPWYTLQRVQDEIDTIGLDAFLVECQHAVDQDRAGVILTQYNETVHVIKRSEVCRAFGLSTYEIPDHWHQYVGFDWGCFPLDTEILTQNGWRQHDQLEVGDVVAAYDWNGSRKIVWTPLQGKVYKDSEPLLELTNKSFRFQCTPDHYWAIRRQKKGTRTRTTYAREKFSDLPKCAGACNIIAAAKCDDAGTIKCTPAQAAVLGWIVTDGSVNRKKGIEQGAFIYQKVKPEDVIAVLNASGLAWHEVQPRKDNAVRNFYLPTASWRALKALTGFTTKDALPALVTRLSPSARKAMMDAMLLAEGSRKTKYGQLFQQVRGPVMDAFQILATLCGRRMGLEREHESEWGKSNRVPLLRYNDIQYPKVAPLPGLHKVWCPTVAEGTVVARQRGQVTITGNSTPGHDCVILFFAVSAMNSALPGITLLHKCMTFPQSTLAGTVAHRLLNYVLRKTQADPRKYIELGLLDRATGDPGDALAIGARKRVVEELAALTNYRMWHMSHEAKAVRDIFRVIYGLGFQACNPKRAGGVPQIEQHLRVDMTEDHPFRLGAKGLSRMYIVVDDAEYEAPKTDDGMALVRYEFPEWRWRAPVLTTAGYLDERPLKQFDNCGNAAMMVFTHFGMQSHPLNYSERVEAAIPKDFRYAELLKNSPFEAGLTPEQEMAHLIAIRDARRKVRPSIERFDEYGEKVL